MTLLSKDRRPAARKGRQGTRWSPGKSTTDGKEAVTFLVKVKQAIEDPARLIIGI